MKTKLLRKIEKLNGMNPYDAMEELESWDFEETFGEDADNLTKAIERIRIFLDEMCNRPKEYIVRADEEELGSIYYSVKSCDDYDTTMKNLEMASKYSAMNVWYIDDDMLEDEEKVKELIADGGYDEHFVEMLNVRDNTNGLDTFEYYLTDICGYEAKEIIYKVDFEFEW